MRGHRVIGYILTKTKRSIKSIEAPHNMLAIYDAHLENRELIPMKKMYSNFLSNFEIK